MMLSDVGCRPQKWQICTEFYAAQEKALGLR